MVYRWGVAIRPRPFCLTRHFVFPSLNSHFPHPSLAVCLSRLASRSLPACPSPSPAVCPPRVSTRLPLSLTPHHLLAPHGLPCVSLAHHLFTTCLRTATNGRHTTTSRVTRSPPARPARPRSLASHPTHPPPRSLAPCSPSPPPAGLPARPLLRPPHRDGTGEEMNRE